MGMPWIDRVKDSGELSVYVDPSLQGTTWSTVFAEAMRELNGILQRGAVGVRLTSSSSAPDDQGRGGAYVVVRAANGQISATYARETKTAVFDGNVMHGRTFLFSIGGKIEKAFVFLPLQPRVNTPSGQRAVGAGILKVIAAHELVHACGLSNADHSTDDLFQGFPQVDPGTRPAQDRAISSGRGRMPPLVLARPTREAIRTLWA